ncbi:MAG: organic solvent tolerance protein [Bdellovibrionales bacterium CG10_big_fil_rev_8_21_14_0_10_45_34]|nr:MAG: organic solvent tolerance protein [Bdellovibrionales bacterium CG10_big_fil_rev_8_21_14_0_10_45_34]
MGQGSLRTLIRYFLLSNPLSLSLLRGLLLVMLISLSSGTAAFAKDMTSRLGIGYSNQLYNNVPSVKTQYYPSREIGLSAALGIDSGDTNSKFGLLVQIRRIVFEEPNMNFYMGGGGGLISQKVSTTNESGYELMATFGAEFFFSGLENLGLTFEAGFGVVSISSEVRFRTIAHHPLNAGMIFYF